MECGSQRARFMARHPARRGTSAPFIRRSASFAEGKRKPRFATLPRSGKWPLGAFGADMAHSKGALSCILVVTLQSRVARQPGGADVGVKPTLP